LADSASRGSRRSGKPKVDNFLLRQKKFCSCLSKDIRDYRFFFFAAFFFPPFFAAFFFAILFHRPFYFYLTLEAHQPPTDIKFIFVFDLFAKLF